VRRYTIADLCLFEVLQGVNPPPALIKARKLLREFAVIAVGGESVAVAAAQNAQVLRSRGIQVTTVDCLLATYCIMNGLRFLTADKDFEPFALHLGLDLVR
jgi:predicted nucleic acid-binding protein